ncbi:MAG: N(4)-(beta-N-acetylglucosaminyl)-L-asparaginase [Candidatus Pseudobacter hemicellulosilyticus]|uniref:N(4)-(Beta-N-acetylglucosaminyl)-L-asparaginase n=1 Tax=Candidatus Pseudobacter hemicellulosilyticus TaxID=3121375 RepID=A0AAJ6BIC7_9BACT|nr:MAG: N(4)-(beta-N-acetylglucosaminyl)-L-asparaginase [Pseudobacter sp.]
MSSSTRRKFLQRTLVLPAGLLPGVTLFSNTKPRQSGNNGPVVVSTWSSGKVANAAAWPFLGKEGHALDAVENGVRVIEADPRYQTVGYGGLPDRDGRVTLDACIMDEQYRCGSVMCLEHIKHPISVARLIMEKTPHIILVGEGALRFALANGFTKENLLTPEAEKAWKEWLKTSNYAPVINIEDQVYNKHTDPMPGGPDNHDTIGMLAIDAAGRMSGACTTSGLAYKMQGRVGDSPVIGSGLYVDGEAGAATASGVGEEVIRIVGAHLVVELIRQGHDPEAACKQAVERIIRRNPVKAKAIQVGFLALSRSGQHGAYALQKGFTYAVKTTAGESIIAAKSIY